MKVKITLTTLLVFLLSLCFLFAACNNTDRDGMVDTSSEGSIDKSIIEAYRFIPEFADIGFVTGYIKGMFLIDDLVYFSYVVDSTDLATAKIKIEGMKPNGTPVSTVEIPVPFDNASVAGISVTESGNFVLIYTGINKAYAGFDFTLIYTEYTSQGTQLRSREITGIIQQSGNTYPIEDAIITADGDILLFETDSTKSTVYILDDNFNLHGQMEAAPGASVCQIKDGRVFVVYSERGITSNRTVLREVDFTNSGWGKSFIIDVSNIREMYPARADEPFDLYISDGTHLFGYNIGAGVKTMIFNWVETGIEIVYYAHLVSLDENRFVMLIGDRDNSTNTWRAEYAILTRMERTELTELEIITLVVESLYADSNLRNQVQAFNRSSQTHQIEVIEFQSLYDIWDENNTMSWYRFMVELMTGKTPDIMYGLGADFDIMAERGMLLDLYPYIDADPELSRSDFFPNVLKVTESADGSLYEIPNRFMIYTMIGMPDMVGNIQSWTFEKMLALLDKAEDYDVPFLFAETWTSEWLLAFSLRLSGHNFINWEENKANLDSADFIGLLETVSRLPLDFPPRDVKRMSSAARMFRGEQMLDIIYFGDLSNFQYYTGALGEDVIFLGVPTPSGGAHAIETTGFSISASSKHKDEAWSFVRSFLMPDIDLSQLFAFPIRIDVFDKLIEERKTPMFETDKDGNEVEIPIGGGVGRGGDEIIWIYSLTSNEERILREVVEGASIKTHENEVLMNMINEELPSFLAGSRSAADTARILQNRVQTYLNERG